MQYIKFDDNGENAYPAPFKKVMDDGTILWGYNAIPKRLLRDGWLPYEGTCPLCYLKLVDGQIVEYPPEPVPPPRIYTKLHIRRALRAAGMEDILDSLLELGGDAQKDWLDAQEIDLDDPVLNQRLTPETKALLIDILEGSTSEA